jgi:hypothetical protein
MPYLLISRLDRATGGLKRAHYTPQSFALPSADSFSRTAFYCAFAQPPIARKHEFDYARQPHYFHATGHSFRYAPLDIAAPVSRWLHRYDHDEAASLTIVTILLCRDEYRMPPIAACTLCLSSWARHDSQRYYHAHFSFALRISHSKPRARATTAFADFD